MGRSFGPTWRLAGAPRRTCANSRPGPTWRMSTTAKRQEQDRDRGRETSVGETWNEIMADKVCIAGATAQRIGRADESAQLSQCRVLFSRIARAAPSLCERLQAGGVARTP